MRGLKRLCTRVICLVDHIAPHAGARIETPLRIITYMTAAIAPFVGARIETDDNAGIFLHPSIAPHAGARIETMISYLR